MRKNQFRMLACPRQGIEMMFADTDHTFGKHTHEQFGLGLILHGAQKSSSQSGMVEAIAGDIITVNPGEVHDGAPLSDGGRSWQMIYLDPAVVDTLIAEINEEGSHVSMEFHHPQIRDKFLARLFRRYMHAAMEKQSNWTLPLDESLLLLLRSLLQPARTSSSRVHLKGISNAKSLIDMQPGTAWTLEMLATQAGLSRFQFIRHFERATGLTPHAYILQRRIHLARQMIRLGKGLTDIAADCGFSDQSHMTRQFIRRFGLSPGTYARGVFGPL